jgi:diguanylate cyclase (GGDEF)-like protein
MFLDIDKFKRVNDELGHHAGDLVLQHVAMLIDSQLRTSDIIARYGGEEFVVLLPSTHINFALEIAERVRRRVEEYDFVVPGHDSLPVTISIGVAELGAFSSAAPHPVSEQAKVLVDSADQALFRAKEGGRNQVVSASAAP